MDSQEKGPSTARRTTAPRGALTDRRIETAKPNPEKDQKLADGNGLYLLVKKSGVKLFRYKYHFSGKEKLMALGQYPETKLAAARAKRDEARARINAGADPMAERKSEKVAQRTAAMHSFKSVAEQWWETWKVGKSEQHAGQVWRRFQRNVFPSLGARPIEAIETPEIVMMLKRMETRKVIDLAKRALQTTNMVFRYAMQHGLVKGNPADAIRPSDVLPAVQTKNLARIDSKRIPDLLRGIDAYQGAPATRLALRLIALTFVRTNELRGARWSEIDFENARWDIPGERMKKKTPHVVPLSRQAVDVLRTLHLISGYGELLFPGERDHDKPMSNNTILKALERMGFKGEMTGHGFRGLASTELHELGYEHAHIELQLAHLERNKVSAAYNHATYLPQRGKMMQAWADYLDGCRAGNVTPIRRWA